MTRMHNPNGITWEQWAAAAGWDTSGYGEAFSKTRWRSLKQAWAAGEDPSEYRQDAPKRVD